MKTKTKTVQCMIVSSGQTGADRGALDAALEIGLQYTGTCPRGRKGEDGLVPPRYQLTESNSNDPADRIDSNVRQGDATLLLTFGRLTVATRVIAEAARRHSKPCLHLDLNIEPTDDAVRRVRAWLGENQVKILNVAGSRESESAGLQGAVKDLLIRVFA